VSKEARTVKGDDIANRLLDLAIFCLGLVSRIEATTTGKHIARQLVRCSSSSGANYEEARSAESHADFIHKLGIGAKEVRETIWWLRLIDRARLAPRDDVAHWIDEANQLLAILIASARTARGRAQQCEAPRLRAAPRIP
jgi:four helix bundle protein